MYEAHYFGKNIISTLALCNNVQNALCIFPNVAHLPNVQSIWSNALIDQMRLTLA